MADRVTGTLSGALDDDRSIIDGQFAAVALTDNNNTVGTAAEGDFGTVSDDHFSIDILDVVTDLDFAGKSGVIDDDLTHDVHGVDLVVAGGVGDGKRTVAADTDVTGFKNAVSHGFAGHITEDHIIGSGNAGIVTDDHLTADIDVGISSEVDAAVVFSVVPVADIGVGSVEVTGEGVFAFDVDRTITLTDTASGQGGIRERHRTGEITDGNLNFAGNIEFAVVFVDSDRSGGNKRTAVFNIQ